MASKKDLHALVKRAERQGWTITRTRGNHFKWLGPNGGTPYFSSSTPSDVKACKNIERDLTRRGLTV